ncbi:MAG TPA: hypothetical protein VI461_16635 [Chitinophagaceae bacterium]|nr:hypothetical protein [Chitinophagaceae bacterium]
MTTDAILDMSMFSKDSSLYGIVNNLIHESALLAVDNRNYVVNNIPDDLCLQTNSAVVSTVLNKLVNTVIRHTKNSVILISAKVYGMTILVQIKSKGNISPALPEDMGYACMNAQKTGGIIEMIQCESEQASFAYCFLNVAGAA